MSTKKENKKEKDVKTDVKTEVKSEVIPMSQASEEFTYFGSDQNFKVGQKYPTPAPGNGDRVFYETLYDEKPDSEMAQEWCLQYGILDEKVAKKVFDLVAKRKGKKIEIESPVKKPPAKAAAPTKETKAAPPAKKEPASKKRRKLDDDDLDDTGMEDGDVWEGRGRSGI